MSGAEAFSEPERWWEEAACRDLPKQWWYPERNSPATYVLAKTICDLCPVAEECLEEALAIEYRTSKHFRNGMWGGLTPDERAKLAKQLRVRQLAKERPEILWAQHPQHSN